MPFYKITYISSRLYLYIHVYIIHVYICTYISVYRKFILFFNFSFKKLKVYYKVYIIDTCTWYMYLYGM